ncbi:MAG: hypothetical protein RBR08_00895 [Desulforegulaceae bacterium]|nr:hypothetical protein [Desulforegulaceae bacterium]
MYFPDLNPVLKGLNTYYIKTEKLIEHFQGEVGNGVIYFKGPLTEGLVFFESDHYLKSFFKKNNKIISGKDAFSLIMEYCEKSNYEIYIYYLEPDEVYLWSEILMSVPVNTGISLNQKSLKGLLDSFKKDKETGYFTISDSIKKYGIFFAYGEIAGYLVNEDIYLRDSKKYEDFLVEITKFIDKNKPKAEIFKKSLANSNNSISEENKGLSENQVESAFPSKETIGIMGEFIFVLDDYFSKNKKIKLDFLPLLKKKFIEHIEEYDFLDPFAAEFVYSKGKIKFIGSADEKTFVQAIFRCIYELCSEINQLDNISKIYKKWFQKYNNFADRYNLKFE